MVPVRGRPLELVLVQERELVQERGLELARVLMQVLALLVVSARGLAHRLVIRLLPAIAVLSTGRQTKSPQTTTLVSTTATIRGAITSN
jgi:C4-dicarboxylate transporter